jgi:hypothetical protein
MLPLLRPAKPCALKGRKTLVGLPGAKPLLRGLAAMLTPNWLHMSSSNVASRRAL